MTETKTSNRSRETRSGVIGRPFDRIDGPLKVRGDATYAYENTLERTAFGYILGSAVAKGRIAEIDTAEAERAPAVLLVMTHRNAPAQPDFGPTVTPTVPEVFTRGAWRQPLPAYRRLRRVLGRGKRRVGAAQRLQRP
nr:hypothetical protein [Mesorhizobium sp.]